MEYRKGPGIIQLRGLINWGAYIRGWLGRELTNGMRKTFKNEMMKDKLRVTFSSIKILNNTEQLKQYIVL